VFIMHMQELPRNAMGKVQRTELARIAVEATRARRAPPVA
jgi:acyl-coenzyme A synthetase/AMP-(fatty) acid ligase